jgi:RNA polymerase sigma-70 factor, ECF subfamily
MTSPNDELLVRQTQSGDSRAYDTLVERYQQVLFNLAYRLLGNSEDARDAVQTTFLRVYRSLDSFDPRFRFFSWLYRIAMNESLRLAGKQRPRQAVSESTVSTEKGPGDRLEELDRGRIVQEALDQLTIEYRQVVVLRYFADLSQREIGELLGIPEKTVKSRLFTARRLLGEGLARKGVVEA